MSQRTAAPSVLIWFIASATVFFTRAILFSTWVSRGPEVQQALNLNTVEMGLFTMLYPLGGLAGILFANYLTLRFGARLVGSAVFTIGAVAMALLGLALPLGSLPLATIALFAMGLPMAIADFLGNVEGTAVDKASPKSLLPAIHGTWGIGMLLGAGVSTVAIEAGWTLTAHYLVVAAIVAGLSIWAAMQFPSHLDGEPKPAKAKGSERQAALGVWRERRTLLIAVIGFSFVMAEISAGTWVPIALTLSGFSGSEAAAAFGLFWIVITIARLTGGFLVQAIGRFRTVLFSALMTAVGILIFMLVEVVALPYLGLVLWGWGMAMGFPMAVSAMGDDPAKSSHRINMIITVVYISSISVGPLLGGVGQVAGIYVAFGIPLALMLASAALSPVTKAIGRSGA